MRSSKLWLIAFAFLIVLAVSARSALATTYVRGYVRPSGDGLNTCVFGGNCEQFINSGIFLVDLNLYGALSTQQTLPLDEVIYSPDGTNLYDFDAVPLNLLGIQPGSVVTFVFGVN